MINFVLKVIFWKVFANLALDFPYKTFQHINTRLFIKREIPTLARRNVKVENMQAGVDLFTSGQSQANPWSANESHARKAYYISQRYTFPVIII